MGYTLFVEPIAEFSRSNGRVRGVDLRSESADSSPSAHPKSLVTFALKARRARRRTQPAAVFDEHTIKFKQIGSRCRRSIFRSASSPDEPKRPRVTSFRRPPTRGVRSMPSHQQAFVFLTCCLPFQCSLSQTIGHRPAACRGARLLLTQVGLPRPPELLGATELTTVPVCRDQIISSPQTPQLAIKPQFPAFFSSLLTTLPQPRSSRLMNPSIPSRNRKHRQ